MTRRLLALAALSAALAPAARADDILLYDQNATNRNARAALTALGYPYTAATSGTFELLVSSGLFEVVVMDMPSTVPTGSWQAALSRHVSGGGKVVMSYWDFDSDATLPGIFGVRSAREVSSPGNVYRWDTSHAIFTTPYTVPNMTVKSDGWGDDGDYLTVSGSATLLAGYTTAYSAGSGSIAEGNSGRTVYNGFLWDEFTGDEDGDGMRDVVELIANQLYYVIEGGCADTDGDGYTATTCGGTDCDDADATVHPGAPETCDGDDEDCDGAVDEGLGGAWYRDADGDRYGDASTVSISCSTPSGYVANGTDCNDTNASVNPAAGEVCNGLDDDCDTVVDDAAADATNWYADRDTDGYGDPTSPSRACTAPAGHVSDYADCLDTDASVHPGATEVCNGRDDDCDGAADDAAVDASTWHADADTDGFGDPAVSVTQCSAPAGYRLDAGDCDDADATAYPGATEWCDLADDDCDGFVDEGAADAATWHADADGDTYGDPSVTAISCAAPSGYLADDTDCDDADPGAHPGAYEVPYDGIDQDCLDGDALDLDGDGYTADFADGSDCADEDPDVHPGALEIADGVDADCDGRVDEGTDWYDDDGDGYTEDGGDCDDGDTVVSPAGTETADGVDEDCDGRVDEGTDASDDDLDGRSEAEGDCNDGDARRSPDHAEIEGNGVDDDCDGEVDTQAVDADADGYTAEGGDCDEADATSFPGAEELADERDNDCDGTADEGTDLGDADADGLTPRDGDCDDTDPAVGAGAVELTDGVDNDCDGRVDEGTTRYDDDGDGYTEEGGDCDDANASFHPAAEEILNGADDDCDGSVDGGLLDADGDGYTGEAGDCDDREGWTNPGMTEQCDSIDNDCDGEVDEDCVDEGESPPDGESTSCGCAAGDGVGSGLAFVALAAVGALHRGRRRPYTSLR